MSIHGRRRLVLLLVVLVVIAAAAAGLMLAGGSASVPPVYRGAGGSGASATLAPGASGAAGAAGPSGAAGAAGSGHRAFRPAPAAVAYARRLTLPQQVAQLFMVSVDGSDAPAAARLAPADPGGVVLTSASFLSDGQVGALAAEVQATVRNAGAPAPLIAATQEGGPQTAFPDLPPEGEARIGAGADLAADARTAGAQALLAAQKLEPLHVNMTIAPLADVDTPNGALSGRLFGTDPHGVAQLALAAVLGYARGKLIDAVAHFPGSGAASADPDQLTASVGGSLAQLQARDLIPFAAVVNRAPVIEMSNASYAALDGVTPASLLPEAVALLRHTYGYIRTVMSDDLDATLNATGESAGAVALAALEAGDDLLYITGPAIEHLHAYDAVLAAAEHSARIRALVHGALLHDLTLKDDYGLL